jgi:hypothetical protein
MPKAFKISSYLGKDAEKILIQTRNMGAVLGASLIISGLVLKYTKSELAGATSGVLVASTGGALPAVVSIVAFFPSILTKIKSGVSGTV